MFIHVGAVWHVNVNYQKAQQPPEPGHASDHYCFLLWTKSESGRQAASIPSETRACCGRIFLTTIDIIEFVPLLPCNGINLRVVEKRASVAPPSYSNIKNGISYFNKTHDIYLHTQPRIGIDLSNKTLGSRIENFYFYLKQNLEYHLIKLTADLILSGTIPPLNPIPESIIGSREIVPR